MPRPARSKRHVPKLFQGAHPPACKPELRDARSKTMATQIPSPPEPSLPASNEVLLVASGDSRPSANETCWPAQAEVERKLTAAFAAEGIAVRRAHPYDPEARHGFISSQRMGMDVFMNIHPEARVVVAEAVWQYSHHVLPGLRSHRGPILTAANWSGQWPGLVGMLNLNGSMYKAGVPFGTIWSLDFTDDFFRRALRQWLAPARGGRDASPAPRARPAALPRGPPRRARGARPQPGPPARTRRYSGAGGRDGPPTGAATPAPQSHHGHLRRRLHGYVQRHRRRRAAEPAGDLQGAPQPVRAGGQDERGRRGRCTAGAPVVGQARRAIRDWAQPRDRPYRRPDPRAMQYVHCGRAHGPRIWLRPDRHTVPARAQGHGPGFGPGRRPAEQSRPPASDHRSRGASVPGPGVAALQ